VTLAGLKFRLNCLVEQTRFLHRWTLRKKMDNLQKKRVYIVNQKTRNFWTELKPVIEETNGLFEDILNYLEKLENERPENRERPETETS
jgi:hypothetical protein